MKILFLKFKNEVFCFVTEADIHIPGPDTTEPPFTPSDAWTSDKKVKNHNL